MHGRDDLKPRKFQCKNWDHDHPMPIGHLDESSNQQQLQATNYQLALWSRLLKPFSYFGLALMALAIVLGPMRSTGLGPRIALGLIVGLTFKYLQDLFAPMAVVFALPAALAVALPIGAIGLSGYLVIRRYA